MSEISSWIIPKDPSLVQHPENFKGQQIKMTPDSKLHLFKGGSPEVKWPMQNCPISSGHTHKTDRAEH